MEQLLAGENKTALIALNDAIQPGSARLGTDKDEEAGGGNLAGVAGCFAGDSDGFEMVLTVNFGYLRAVFDMDVFGLRDLVYQVLRHSSSQGGAANKHDDPARIF